MAININDAQSLEGRIDVGRAVGSDTTAMYVYDLAPGQSSCPYHYEYAEEWLLVVDGTLVVRTPAGERTLSKGDLDRFPPGPAGAHKIMNRSEIAGTDADVLERPVARRLGLSRQRQGRRLDGRRERPDLPAWDVGRVGRGRGRLGQRGLTGAGRREPTSSDRARERAAADDPLGAAGHARP